MNKIDKLIAKVKSDMKKYKFDNFWMDSAELSRGGWRTEVKLQYKDNTVNSKSVEYKSRSGAVNCYDKVREFIIENKDKYMNMVKRYFRYEDCNYNYIEIGLLDDKIVVDSRVDWDSKYTIEITNKVNITTKNIINNKNIPNEIRKNILQYAIKQVEKRFNIKLEKYIPKINTIKFNNDELIYKSPKYQRAKVVFANGIDCGNTGVIHHEIKELNLCEFYCDLLDELKHIKKIKQNRRLIKNTTNKIINNLQDSSITERLTNYDSIIKESREVANRYSIELEIKRELINKIHQK